MYEERESHVVSGLRRKRAQLHGMALDHERRARAAREALAHIDATLRLFDPNADPDSIPSKRPHRKTRYFDGPELARLIQDELRKADGAPVTTLELFDAAIRTGDIPDRPHIRVTLKERIIKYLNSKADQGLILRVGLSHQATWTLPDVPEFGVARAKLVNILVSPRGEKSMAWETLPNGNIRLQRLKDAEPALIAGSIPALRLEIWGQTADSPTTAIQLAMTVEEARTIAAGLLQAAERALAPPNEKPS